MMIGEVNPWLSMWAQPRRTIRTLIHTQPTYGVFSLAAVYTLQNIFYLANYWSLGLTFPFYTILVAGILLAPVVGVIWLYFTGWLLYLTGRWLEGKAPMLRLRTVAAWSQIPTSANLLLWFFLLIAHPEYAFIQNAEGPSSLFIHLIVAILGVWSIVLLIQSIREVQGFSLSRAVINFLLSSFLSAIATFFLFAAIRFAFVHLI